MSAEPIKTDAFQQRVFAASIEEVTELLLPQLSFTESAAPDSPKEERLRLSSRALRRARAGDDARMRSLAARGKESRKQQFAERRRLVCVEDMRFMVCIQISALVVGVRVARGHPDLEKLARDRLEQFLNTIPAIGLGADDVDHDDADPLIRFAESIVYYTRDGESVKVEPSAPLDSQ